ncbi:uncharacterized protein [Euphorbia lathyris]|uniref:uncharacterized protein n=1 Tax=Euphorbia lathyris TaxID=212925 RepID=UPI0033136CF7
MSVSLLMSNMLFCQVEYVKKHAVYLMNCLPTPLLSNKSPYQEQAHSQDSLNSAPLVDNRRTSKRHYKQAVQFSEWQEAMKEELTALNKNQTWEIYSFARRKANCSFAVSLLMF